MTSGEAFDLEHRPEHLVLIGAVLPLMRRLRSFRIDPGKVAEKGDY